MKIKMDYAGELKISELDDKYKEIIKNKFQEMAEELLTEELIEEIAKEAVKSALKSEVNNMAQSQEFRKKINTMVYPKLAEIFNLL